MKKILTATLPALALLALGGCATTGAVSSTEDDGVYYSSADRTTIAPPAARPDTGYGYETARVQTQTTQATEDANPDYQGDGTTQSGTGTDYYDDSYTSASPSGFGQPYTGPGVSTYNYTPSWSVSPSFYGSPFGYGLGASIGYGYGGFGGYGYPGYASFYDPFYSPYGFGYGSGFSLGFGYGFGGFGYPYGFGSPFGYSPYAYGYGGGYPYGGGYYGSNYYEGGYGGARRYVYKNAIVNGGYPNGYDRDAIRVGRREGRAANAVGTAGMANPGGGVAPAGVIGGRRITNSASTGFTNGANVAPGQLTGNDPATGGRRFDQSTVNPNSPNGGGRGAWRDMNNGTANGAATGNYNQPRSDAASANPGAAQPRRGGFFRDVFGAPANGGGNTNAQNGFSQPQRANSQRAYSPQSNQGFSQPRMEQQRSFSQPSQPSFGGSRGGGGNFGGGGGGAAGGFGGGGGGGGRRGR